MDDDFLTIMFVRNSGKIRSIKVETKKLFYLAAGIISLIVAFGGLVYGYFAIFQQNVQLMAMVNHHEYAAYSDSTTQDSYKDALREGAGVHEAETEAKEEKISQTEEIPQQPQVVENVSGKVDNIFVMSNDSFQVAVRDFHVEKNGTTPGVKVILSLHNVFQHTTITGYWVIVGERKKNNRVVYKSFPEMDVMANGEVKYQKNITYSSATWFSIDRFKPVKGNLEFDKDFDDYDAITIYIFSIKGEILLKSKYNRWELVS